ncbi:MAG: VWA domain-containing protein [Acidobacteriota bacterium]|nr:VWA domain-containing protein [Acidobacteriota bacterium]
MSRQFLFTIIFSLLTLNVFAQSGRVKTPETSKTPPRPRVVYVPTQTSSDILKPAPTPTPKTNSKTENETDDDNEVISVESNLVPIPVSVLDAQNRAVTNLRLEDFSLEIDGRPAEIGELSRSDAPVSLALLFDNSSSVTTAREFEKKAAIRFFKRVIRPDRDFAALYSVSTGTRLVQPLTKNVSQIIRAIENFPPPAGATALLDAIIKASEYLKDSNGRRVIVIVSDGEDTMSDATFDDTVKAAQAANCQVYVVKTKEFENFKQTGARGGNANIRVLAAERRMQELAAQTGGTVYSPIDERELDQAFDQISGDLAQQYVLSYYPENETEKRGEFRTISLAIKGKQNLNVRTRKGYYVPKRRIVN